MRLSDIMSAAGLSIYAEVALALFLASFLAVAWSVLAKRNQATWDAARLIPLSDDKTPDRMPGASTGDDR